MPGKFPPRAPWAIQCAAEIDHAAFKNKTRRKIDVFVFKLRPRDGFASYYATRLRLLPSEPEDLSTLLPLLTRVSLFLHNGPGIVVPGNAGRMRRFSRRAGTVTSVNARVMPESRPARASEVGKQKKKK